VFSAEIGFFGLRKRGCLAYVGEQLKTNLLRKRNPTVMMTAEQLSGKSFDIFVRLSELVKQLSLRHLPRALQWHPSANVMLPSGLSRRGNN
jgi:hypothetical protein